MARKSPYAKFARIPIGHCLWTDGFWADKFRSCEHSMIPYMEEVLCGDIGHALNNFKKAAGKMDGEHKGMYWHDGDFYKWMEAATYVYAQNQDKKILSKLNEYIEIIGAAQEDDGYLQTQIQLRPEVDRYENRKYHEMYNSGHLLTSACVHFQVTNERSFLDIAIKHADLLYTIFYPDTKHYGRFGFNQTQIIGLVDLYRITKNRKYLDLALKFINRRGSYPVEDHPTTEGYPIGDMVQERVPIREANEAAGHAVLALYYYAGITDVYAETGEDALINALDRLWKSVTQRKMYVTGAVGQTHYGASSNRDKIEEGFIDDYMMPNMTAYNETCANICNAMFSYRMMEIKGESKYVDIIELVLFNSALSGISLTGDEYFYANPLRMIHNARSYKEHENDTESPEREPYLECFCCPPNLVRTIAKVSKWAYSLSNNGIAVNLFGSNQLNTNLLDGSDLKLKQVSNYPWEGKVHIAIEACKEEAFEMLVRIPQWTKVVTIKINGTSVTKPIRIGEYLRLERKWNSGDCVEIDMPMAVQLIEGHPRIEEVRNQVALKRGPLIYCVESPDLPKETSILDVHIHEKSKIKVEFEKDLLGGVNVLYTDLLLKKARENGMYNQVLNRTWENYSGKFVPYYSWSNRGKAEMTVFVPIIWDSTYGG